MAIETGKTAAGQNFLPDFIRELTDFEVKLGVHEQIGKAISFYRFMPSVKTIVDTIASLILTDVDVDIEDEKTKEGPASNMLYNVVDIVGFLRQVVVEYLVAGNVFVGITLPAEKSFECPKCRSKVSFSSMPDTLEYVVDGDCFHFKCPEKGCGRRIAVDPNNIREETTSLQYAGTSTPELKIFSAQRVSLIPAVGSNKKMMIYELSDEERVAINTKKGYMFVLKNTPLVFIRAAMSKDKKVNIRLPDSVIHVHDTELSDKETGWGVVPLMSAYKLVYYLSALRKQNLEMAALRPTPVHLLSPATGHETTNLKKVKGEIKKAVADAVESSKRFPFVFSPIPVSSATLTADFKPLNLVGEIRLAQSDLAVSLGLPSDLVYGGSAQWSSASANIRMMEKRFVFLYDALERICDKVATIIAALTRKKVSIAPMRLKVLDDQNVAQQIAGLYAQGRVSLRTMHTRLGLDLDKELARIRDEIPQMGELDKLLMSDRMDFEADKRRQGAKADMIFQAGLQKSFGGEGRPAETDRRPSGTG